MTDRLLIKRKFDLFGNLLKLTVLREYDQNIIYNSNITKYDEENDYEFYYDYYIIHVGYADTITHLKYKELHSKDIYFRTLTKILLIEYNNNHNTIF